LYIPRALIDGGVPEDAEWKDIKATSKITLRKPQRKIVGDFFSFLEENPSGGIISAGTGTGKTIMGIEIILRLGKKALVIVPTERIFRQWIDRIRDKTDIKKVGVIRGPLCDYEHPISVAMLHSISKKRFDFLYEEFGTVVFDEVHTISTEYFNTVAPKFWCKTRVGLSATPRRKDGMQNVFFWHIGPVASTYSKVDAHPKVIVVDYYNPDTHHRGCTWNGDLSLGKYYNKLAKCSHRNETLAKYIRGAYNKDHDILVLTERLRHIDTLMKLSNIPKEDCGKLTANVKEIDRKVIFGTYQSAGLGLDIPRLSCLVFAMPHADIVQPVGRVLRSKDKTPVVIDFVDSSSRIMQGWFRKRKKYYDKIADEIITMGAGYNG
jgi:superfamily II DNA or RNA helicase